MDMIERTRARTARIGVFGVGHETYWEQFPGLRDNLMGYHERFKGLLPTEDIELRDYGLLDRSEKAYEALGAMRGDGLDLVFCNMLTYATSSVFAPIIRELDVPVVLAALQPQAAMDYTAANTFMQLENDNVCSVPEFTGVAQRLGKRVWDVVFGTLDEPGAAAELASWCDVARALHALKGARLGLMGHVLESMYDMHADPTALSAAFGLHVPLLEAGQLFDCWEAVS